METELHPGVDRILSKGTVYTLALDVATTLVLRLEQFNIYPRLFIIVLNELMNNAVLSPCLRLVQARYIFRVVITQMRRSKGYEVNLTSIGLTSGLDCLRVFPQSKRDQSF